MPFAAAGNTVTSSAQIVDGIITGADLAADTLTTREIGPNAVGDSEVAAHTTTKITTPFSLVTGTVPLTQGGTGQITAQAAINALHGTINQGDLFYDNGTNVTRLTPGTSGQFLKTLGASANPAWASITASKKESAFVTDVTVSNTTTETALMTFSLSGGELGTGGILHLHLNMANMNTQGAGTVNLKCYFGATAIDLWNYTGAAFATSIGRIDFYVYANGATNSQVLTGRCFGGTQSSGGGGSAMTAINRLVTGTAAIDSTSAQTVKITFTAAVADPATSVQVLDGYAELIQ